MGEQSISNPAVLRAIADYIEGQPDLRVSVTISAGGGPMVALHGCDDDEVVAGLRSALGLDESAHRLPDSTVRERENGTSYVEHSWGRGGESAHTVNYPHLSGGLLFTWYRELPAREPVSA